MIGLNTNDLSKEDREPKRTILTTVLEFVFLIILILFLCYIPAFFDSSYDFNGKPSPSNSPSIRK